METTKNLNSTISDGSVFPFYLQSAILNGEKGVEHAKKYILKEQILSYVKSHPKAYVSEISEALEIPILKAIELITELKETGKLRLR